jgi:hypothetical protein
MADVLRRLLRIGVRSNAQGGAARRLRPARDVLAGERDGVTVLLDLRREVYLGLDEVGTAIWREIERGAEPAQIVERLCSEFDAPREVVEQDTHAFLATLVRRGLAVRA